MRLIVGVLALVVLAMVATTGLQAGLENAGTDHTITNETWTPDAGNITVLDESQRTGAYYSHNVTVYDENDTKMDPGTDYEWYAGNGTIKTLTGGELDGDTTATITYAFQQTNQEQRDFTALLGQIPRLIGFSIPVFALLAFIALARGGI